MFSSQNSQASSDVNYIDDVFSTWLYKGNGSTQTITNNIDLAGKGGLTWIKYRDGAFGNGHYLYDTVRGAGKALQSNLTDAETAVDSRLTSFNSNGFSLSTAGGSGINANTYNYVSWTFRKQPKFFDVVTYTGNNAAQTIPHNLGSTPGCVIIKCTNVAGTSWWVRHRSIPGNAALLNSSTGFAYNINDMPAVSSTALSFSSGASTNNSGETYVAYLFAHNAGGFGLTGNDNVISCGSFTTDGTGAAGNITLGYESQLVMFKRSDGVGNWQIVDTMRGSSLTSYNYLSPNTSGVESNSTSAGQGIFPTATGFFVGTNFPAASANYIYIAIRRPMKVPTLGTSVFSVDTTTAANDVVSTLTFPDLGLFKDRTTIANWFASDRLRGFSAAYYTPTLYTNLTNAEATPTTGDTVTANGYNNVIYAGGAGVAGNYPLLYSFKRAPGFFDEVCYTGTGSLANNQNHNLTVIPELIITKIRSGGTESGVGGWGVYAAPLGITKVLELNTTVASATDNWFQTSPTASVFTVYGNDPHSNRANGNYVAYLFATCLGVSKVGSYTGNGSSQTIACGFTAGARFVMIKRTDATGDWYVWDTARGIVSGNDPHLSINTTAAEVTTDDTIDPDNSGFIVNQVAATNMNVSSATYIFLAIA